MGTLLSNCFRPLGNTVLIAERKIEIKIGTKSKNEIKQILKFDQKSEKLHLTISCDKVIKSVPVKLILRYSVV